MGSSKLQIASICFSREIADTFYFRFSGMDVCIFDFKLTKASSYSMYTALTIDTLQT